MKVKESKPEEKEYQCPSMCITRGGAVFCVKKEGHAGDHRGYRAQWRGSTRVKITERAPI